MAELRAIVMRADLERLGRFDPVRVRQRFLDGFTPEHTSIIEVSGVPAGCIAMRDETDARWLEHFYLAAAHQGGGIGAGVLAAVLESGSDIRPIKLNVLRGSPARRLYERHGFTVESEDPVDVFMVRAAESRNRTLPQR
ncbi:acetyltransferase [Arthrobacter sp. ERGS1:01]|nr:GNAT family N-acetyltransferase [Arthrobacter sp. ERGS1:01]ALE07779.1 acetyltransferase [Arthrobacter sp. ERGS1:01]